MLNQDTEKLVTRWGKVNTTLKTFIEKMNKMTSKKLTVVDEQEGSLHFIIGSPVLLNNHHAKILERKGISFFGIT